MEKARTLPADGIVLDLEDAVAPDAKAAAREAVLAYIAQSDARARLCVRINRLGSAEGLEDAAALARAGARPGFVMAPKVESGRDMELLAQAFAEGAFAEGAPPHLIALIESPLGVEAAFDIARAASMLMFGSFDYAAETGCTQDWAVLSAVRSRLAAAAASAGKPCLDSPFATLDDVEGGAAEARLARAFGFSGKATIHPKFVPGINDAFTPSAEELAQARAIVEAFAAGGQGVGRIGGKLVEAPVARRMQRVLDRAAALHRPG